MASKSVVGEYVSYQYIGDDGDALAYVPPTRDDVLASSIRTTRSPYAE